jgi:hypothetical protein
MNIKECFENLYFNTLEDVEEMDKFLNKYSIPKWKQVYEKHKLVNNKQ